jgi:hypothetical protein
MSSLNSLDLIMKFLPFLIPLVLIEFGLMIGALVHILKHRNTKHLPYGAWIAISFIGIIGPVLYFIIGREDA